MMVRQIFEEAVAKIEANRQREIEVARQRAMQEQIIPFNRDIDEHLRNAIAELQTQHNARISQMQQAFELEKSALADAAAKKKSDNAEAVIFSVSSAIEAEANDAIKRLREIIGEEA